VSVASRRATPAPRRTATKGGTEEIRQKNGRVHAREAGGQGKKAKGKDSSETERWSDDRCGEKGREAGEKMKSTHAATFDGDRRRKRDGGAHRGHGRQE